MDGCRDNLFTEGRKSKTHERDPRGKMIDVTVAKGRERAVAVNVWDGGCLFCRPEDRQKSSWMGRLGGERAVSCEREAGVVLLFLDSGRPRNPPEYSEAAFSKI